MLVESWNTEGIVFVVWRDSNGTPHRESYPASLLKAKSSQKDGYVSPAGGGSRKS